MLDIQNPAQKGIMALIMGAVGHINLASGYALEQKESNTPARVHTWC